MYPEMDLDLKRSNWLGGFGILLMDWSCGPQLASVMEYSLVFGSIGNLTYDAIDVCGMVVKVIPISLVPLRYFIFSCMYMPYGGITHILC